MMVYKVFNNWGESERAPHLRDVWQFCLLVYIYIYLMRPAVYFYFIPQKWPPFANAAIFAADSVRCHGNSLKRRQLAGQLHSTSYRNVTKKISQQHSHFTIVIQKCV